MALPRRKIWVNDGGSYVEIDDPNQDIEPPKQQVTGLPAGGPDGNEGVVGGRGTAIPGRMGNEELLRFLAAEKAAGLTITGGDFPGFPGMRGRAGRPIVTETGRRVSAADATGVDSAAPTGTKAGTTTAAEEPKSTFPSFNDWLASFGGTDNAPATDASSVKQDVANSLAQLQEAMKGLQTGIIDEKTLEMYRSIVSNPPKLQQGKYAALNKRIIPATETIPQGFDLKTGQLIPGVQGVGAHVEYFLVDAQGQELVDAESKNTAVAMGEQFEFESEQSMAFGPLLAQLEANNAQGALEVAKSVVVPYMQHVFDLQLQKEQERAALKNIYAQGELTASQQADQNVFTGGENEKSRQLQKDLQAEQQRFQDDLEEKRQLFEVRMRDLDRQARQREIELQTGFRYDDVEGRVNARKELERLDREKFKLEQQRGSLEILALIGQFPQFRNLLNTPEMTAQFAAMGVDISTMFNKSGPAASDLPSAQAFAQMTPTKQQEALNNLAAKYGVAPEMILAEIQKGQPGGGGRITR